jgi:hypothetical protein
MFSPPQWMSLPTHFEALALQPKGHFTHKPRVVTMKSWEPKRKCPKATQDTSKIMWWGQGPSSVVWSHMWLGPQPNVVSMNSIHVGSSHMIQSNNPTVMRFWSAMVSWFCIRPTSKKWSLENCSSDHETWSIWWHVRIHVDFYNPSCIHLLRWSLKRSVRRTWTGSAFSTNESAWSVMATGSQSRVWSGPNWHFSFTSNEIY